MTSKANIFSALPVAHSDDEDFDDKTNDSKTKEKRVRPKGKKGDLPAGTQQTVTAPNKDSRDHNLKKAANDLDHPHRLDRKSGTGQSAFDKKDKKGGHGKGNWGTLKDEQGKRLPRDETTQDAEDVEEQEEQEDKTITLEEYFEKNSFTQPKQQQINDAKAKVTTDQLTKELGKATHLETRRQKQVDDHQLTHKKANENHAVTMNTEHADLLGFRTGFKTFEARKQRPQRPERTERTETAPTTEQTEQTATTTTTTTEQPATTEQTEQTTQSPTTTGAEGEGKRTGYRGGRGGRGGNRGGNRGDYQKGERGDYQKGERGDYQKGERAPYKGGDNQRGGEPRRGGNYRGKQAEGKGINIEDESSFPKLG